MRTVADEAAFVDEARRWLAANAPEFEDPDEHVSAFPAFTPDQQREQVARARAWEARKAESGWSGLGLPEEVGGRGYSRREELLFTEEEAKYRLPSDVFSVTKGMIVPTLMAWGSERQQCAHIPRILDGSQLWCQLYSEPGAGSDLAGLATRATRTADGWVVNGQKVWTSHGHHADMGYLLARTDPDVPKHKGISAFVVSMNAPGVRATPLRQATGAETFSEVFFDDVVLPDDALLGPVNGGWRVAITTLMNERLSLDGGVVPYEQLVQLAQEYGALERPDMRARLVRLYAHRRVIDLLKDDQLGALKAGRDPGPEGSTAKVVAARAVGFAADIASDVLGADALLDGPWSEFRIGAAGMKLGGGTEEILKNIIAERVLGLPADSRQDRDVPWGELLHG